MSVAVDEKNINKILGEPTDISCIEKGDKDCFTMVAFELYKEVASISTLISSIFNSNDGDISFERNQSVNAGLIIRITKYMRSVLALLCDGVSEHGEVIMTLNRCILESAIKLRFFCEKADQRDYDNFVKSSLKPEKEAYKIIEDNIRERGGELPIEKRMKHSIERTIRLSGYTINDLDSIPQFKNFKDILISLEMENLYSFAQSIPSHSIHGNWVDLLLHNLEESGSGFRPKPESLIPDARLICPINIVILDAIKSYLNKYFSGHKLTSTLLDRISDLENRNSKVDGFHEKSLS
jgi:hypothetical protein